MRLECGWRVLGAAEIRYRVGAREGEFDDVRTSSEQTRPEELVQVGLGLGGQAAGGARVASAGGGGGKHPSGNCTLRSPRIHRCVASR